MQSTFPPSRHSWFGDFTPRDGGGSTAAAVEADGQQHSDFARLWTNFMSARALLGLAILSMHALAAWDGAEAERQLCALEAMEGQEWCWATTLGDIFTMRQEYDRAIEWYRKGQELQPSPKFTDSARSIAHICEIRGDKAGAVAAYREELRLMREEWGIVSGEEREEVERAIRKLQ